MQVIAKKSLGQNFLTSQGALNAMITAGEVSENDIILEIGPGLGALTEKLIKIAGKVIAIEKDTELYAILQEKFAQEIKQGTLELVLGDALEFNIDKLRTYKKFHYKVIANIPYNITGALIRKYLSSDYKPACVVFVMQKEVAERIAKAKKESILSLAVKYYGVPRYVKTVPRGSFSPSPNVDSAIIAIQNIVTRGNSAEEEVFFALLHAGFAHKRKKLMSNLADVVEKSTLPEIFMKLSLAENTRAEDLPLDTWLVLAHACGKAFHT